MSRLAAMSPSLATLLALLAFSAFAGPRTFSFTGIVAHVVGPSRDAMAKVGVVSGASVAGSYTFEVNAPSSALQTVRSYEPVVITHRVIIDGYRYTSDSELANRIDVGVSQYDVYRMTSSGQDSPPILTAAAGVAAAELSLLGVATDELMADVLPLTPPDLSAFDTAIGTLSDGTGNLIQFQVSTLALNLLADTDGDGIVDPIDICALNADPAQQDLDGDGMGDACQCGDLTLDALVTPFDLVRYRAFLADPVSSALTAEQIARCSVIGPPGSCQIDDVAVIARDLALLAPAIGPFCELPPRPLSGLSASKARLPARQACGLPLTHIPSWGRSLIPSYRGDLVTWV